MSPSLPLSLSLAVPTPTLPLTPPSREPPV
jgi:hypothetical protein